MTMFKNVCVLMLLALSAFSQTAAEKFNAAYWASVPAEVRALKDVEAFSSERMEKAIGLALKGHAIDAEIQARGSNPWETMNLRKAYGYTWTPSLLQDPIVIAPGLIVPGVAPYDAANAPKGAIKVSVDVEAYKPFDAPVQVVTADVPVKPWFEVPQGVGKYSVRPGDASPAGAVYAGPEGKFVKVKIANPFGFWAYWEVVK